MEWTGEERRVSTCDKGYLVSRSAHNKKSKTDCLHMMLQSLVVNSLEKRKSFNSYGTHAKKIEAKLIHETSLRRSTY